MHKPGVMSSFPNELVNEEIPVLMEGVGPAILMRTDSSPLTGYFESLMRTVSSPFTGYFESLMRTVISPFTGYFENLMRTVSSPFTGYFES